MTHFSNLADPLIHIGYHRAGSTWLQTYLFSKPSSGYALPFDRRRDIAEILVAPHPLEFQIDVAKEHFRPILTNIMNEGLITVISAERLSGYPDSGGYDSKEIASRMKNVFPGAKILIVIRRQKDILLSTYKVYIWAGGHLTLDEYVSPPVQGRFRQPRFRFQHYAYDKLISYYQDLFGKEQTLVLPFEDIASNGLKAAKEIGQWVGVNSTPDLTSARRINTSLGGFTTSLKRRLNPFIVRDAANGYSTFGIPYLSRPAGKALTRLDKLIPNRLSIFGEHKLNRRIEQLVGDRYTESNKKVEQLTALDLRSRGYDV